jgi:RNA polymerase sigma factor (sigma-70 family)
MQTSPTTRVIEHLRRSLPPRDCAETGDGELLGCFIERRDEAALASLVKRHGPMVWGVCRRLLNHHDAEDAFQATFIVLVRKAASIVPRVMVGNWLYGVAHQTALQARRTVARRRAREVHVTEMPDSATVLQDHRPDLRPLLDQELSRLPDNYRAVIVLCDLEGRTRKEVARQLRVPEGTVAGRLARARTMLSKRLTLRGVTLSGAALAAVLTQKVGSAGVPVSLVSTTIQAATLVAQSAATGAVSAKVAALSEGVLRAMLMNKLKTAIAILTVLGFVFTGATILTLDSATAQEKPPIAGERVKVAPIPADEAPTVWGKEVGGLQAGLHFSNPNDIRIGTKAKAIVMLRNVSEGEITVSAWPLWLHPPGVVDSLGKPVRSTRSPVPLFEVTPTKHVLKPGQTLKLGRTDINVVEDDKEKRPAIIPKGVVDAFSIHVQPGKYKAAIGGFLEEHPTLATASVEFEVKEAQEEPFTAWGKEAGGLQAGIGFRAGEKRAYNHGETVTLIVRLRNVGKEEVKFRDVIIWMLRNPLTVTDSDGKAVYVACLQPDMSNGLMRANDKLLPGREVKYDELELQLKPGSARDDPPSSMTLFGTGKFQLQYRADGISSSGRISNATGKLELEVTEPEKAPPEKETFTAWGKEVGGLQAGLGFRAGEKRTYGHGETVKVVVRVRNLGKEAVEFQHIWAFFVENPPKIIDPDGKQVQLPRAASEGMQRPRNPSVAPGKEIDLYEWEFDLMPAKPRAGRNIRFSTLYGTGKFILQCDRIVGPTSGNSTHPNPTLDKLGTGKLELEIKDAPAEKRNTLTPEEAIKMASDSKLTREFNKSKPAVEFKIEFVTRAIPVKAAGDKKDAGWAYGHSPDDVCLGTLVPSSPIKAKDPLSRNHTRFVATLTAKAINQLNKAGISDMEKHFKGKTVRVTGSISRSDYDGWGSPPEVEIVIDDLNQFEVVK